MTTIDEEQFPVYNDYEEFAANYENDFLKYKQLMPNITLQLYFKEIKKRYKEYFVSIEEFELRQKIHFLKKTYDEIENNLALIEKWESKEEDLDIFFGLVSMELQSLAYKEEKNIREVYFDLFHNDENSFEIELHNMKIIKEEIKKYTLFLNFNEHSLEFNRLTYRDFSYSVQNIFKFIDEFNYEKSNLNIEEQADEFDLDLDLDLDLNQIQIVGLLLRSGIIDFIRQKNKGISNLKICEFIQFITKKPLKAKSISTYIGKNTKKYAIQNKVDENDLDLILNKFNMKPYQS